MVGVLVSVGNPSVGVLLVTDVAVAVGSGTGVAVDVGEDVMVGITGGTAVA